MLVAVAGLAQGSLDVMITVTISPSASVVVVKVAAVGSSHYTIDLPLISRSSTTIGRCSCKGY